MDGIGDQFPLSLKQSRRMSVFSEFFTSTPLGIMPSGMALGIAYLKKMRMNFIMSNKKTLCHTTLCQMGEPILSIVYE